MNVVLWRDVCPDAYNLGLMVVARRRGSAGPWLARRWNSSVAHLGALEWRVV